MKPLTLNPKPFIKPLSLSPKPHQCRSREMANTVATMFAQRRELANKTAQETIVAKAAAKPLFNPTMADTVQAFFTRVVGCEVPESQRRCGGFGVQHELEEDRSKLVGKVK
ncbi:unnamed protein product, partial [Symbiodinium microadriaticum]